MLKRIKNAAKFYADEYKREANKKRAVRTAAKDDTPMISYMGWTGHNNLGDEILYDAHKALFPNLAVVPFRKDNTSKAQSLIKAGFLGGGTLINQSTSWLEQISYIESQNLPLYCFGTGVTQTSFRASHEKTDMDEWVQTLKKFKFVGIRGPYSQKMLQEAGFNNAEIIGDTALALARPDYTPRNKQKKIIGFNYGIVKENQIWGDANEYTENIVKAIRKFIAAGYEVRLLPVWDKDLSSNRELHKRINDKNCVLIEDCYKSLEAYSKELEKCTAFIGQKLHASIMACMLRIPTIMIEYQPKCRDFMASVDMEYFIIKTSECTPQNLMKLFDELSARSDEIQKTLDKRISQYRTAQFKLARKIEEDLLSTSK